MAGWSEPGEKLECLSEARQCVGAHCLGDPYLWLAIKAPGDDVGGMFDSFGLPGHVGAGPAGEPAQFREGGPVVDSQCGVCPGVRDLVKNVEASIRAHLDDVTRLTPRSPDARVLA